MGVKSVAKIVELERKTILEPILVDLIKENKGYEKTSICSKLVKEIVSKIRV